MQFLIKDNDVGLKLYKGKPLNNKSSFELELVESFAKKIQATRLYYNGLGTSVKVFIPFTFTPEPVAYD